MRVGRIVCLSIIYCLLIFLVARVIGEWIVAHASQTDANAEAIKNFKRSEILFVFLNSLAFAIAVTWLSRTREIFSVARYLVPTVLAVAVTYIVLIAVLIIETFVRISEVIAPTGGLIYWIDIVIPGLVAAQLFRLPRRGAPVRIAEAIHPAL